MSNSSQGTQRKGDLAPEEGPGRAIHAAAVAEVYSRLDSRPQGLTTAEVQERLECHGRNRIRREARVSIWRRLSSNFTHLMAWLLWIGGVLAWIAQTPQLAVAVWMVNLINGAFSFWQEYRAEKAIEALQQLLPAYARALRAGRETQILAEELVPGDVIVLGEGDRISADARLVQEAELRVDQSTLTGEPHPLRKASDGFWEPWQSRAEIPNLVFAGTSVAAGTGRAVVYATGMATEFGKIAQLTQALKEEESPLQQELKVVTKIVTAIAAGFGTMFFVLAVVLTGIDLAGGFLFALGMIVAFVPEGMLPAVTLSLAMGVQRMARRHALIKRLSAVETLGCTSVICTDKTGTLTQNEMTVRDLWVAGRRFSVSGVGYMPEGKIVEVGRPVAAFLPEDVRQLLLAAGLCSDARLVPPGEGGEADRWSVLGDPTEAALLVAARKGGLDLEAEARLSPRLRAFPFDSRRRRMSTVHRWIEPEVPFQPFAMKPTPDGLPEESGPGDERRTSSDAHKNYFQTHPVRPQPYRASARADSHSSSRAYVKGAPNEVLALCTRIRHDSRELLLDEAERRGLSRVIDDYSRAGLRVLAVAQRDLSPVRAWSDPGAPQPEAEPASTAEVVERDLTFLGLVTLFDPPRPEVAAAVQKCHLAGIRIIMITGDYGLTAESIARRIGIFPLGCRPRIITAADLDALNDEALREQLVGETLFARVTPEHKLRVVQVLQDLGHVVAVTGDGVNDAPALKQANIGVAMGTGTDVAKEAADMVLADDNFASIVNAIEEGRAVYANIKKFMTLIFTSNFTEAVPFIVFAFSGGRIPLALNVMQVLSVDLGADIVPSLALGAEPPEPGIMGKPPRSLKEHVITRSMLVRAFLFLGPLQAIMAMGAFFFCFWCQGYWGRWLDLPVSGPSYQMATAMTLGTVVMTQMGNLLAQRTERASLLRVGLFSNPLVWVGVVTGIAVVVAVNTVPALQWVFGTAALPWRNWLLLLVLSPALLVADELRKALVRKWCR
jgi:P-type Ca2+ transporter type 2C